MRTFGLVLGFLACAAHARRVQSQLQADDARLEVLVSDDLNTKVMNNRIMARALYWSARGLEMRKCNPTAAFAAHGHGLPARAGRVGMSPRMSVGLYYSTSTGNTETVAEYIADAAGVEDWKDIGDAEEGEFEGHDSIFVGAPTWHTGADTERSGTSWDEWLYDTLPNLDLSGKNVAIFGVGDSGSYSDNYCDAAGELYDLLTEKGAKVFGMSPSDDGFDYTESKSVVDDKFVGKMFDEDNYPDDSEERAGAWVEQLKSEGFM
jgi:flavodoxin I